MTVRNDATRQRIPVREARKLRAVVPRQGQVLLDTDVAGLSELALARVETADADVIGVHGRLAVPAGAPGFEVTGISLAGGKLDCSVGPGRGYMDGWLVENPAAFTLSAMGGAGAQPHPWVSPSLPVPAVVGLKALVRLIDPVEDTALADRALGDAQASGRSLVDWQVFALPVAGPVPLACADVLASPEWHALTAPSTGRLQFIKAAPPASTDPCSLSESGGYTRLENLLYRVEVHRGVLAGNAPDPAIDGPRYILDGLQLKLSRCNASVLVRIDKVDGKTFTVSPAALDPRNWFVEGQLAEFVSIHDDVDTAAAHAVERLFRVARAGDEEVELVDRSASDTVAKVGATDDGTWFLRMWESLPDASEVATVTLDGSGSHSTVIDLGDGIAIQLEGDADARLRRGDYWTCAMRADGEIEWVDGEYEAPMGPERRYAPLAAVNAGPAVEDCRIAVASLGDRTLLYRGGDGQEGMPDPTKPAQRVPLASPLRVAVMRGEQPVAGASVAFSIRDLPAGKTAQLSWQPPSGPAQTGTTVSAMTDAEGLAEVSWEIDPTVGTQWVEAKLAADPAAKPVAPLVFTANLSQASEVGFDPKAIAVFAGITDVQRALEALAGMQQAGCATYVLTPQNWLGVLAALKPGEDAKLCFQRGQFKAEKRVELKGLGHLTLCGAGEATQITVATGECAIAFTACESVHVGNLAASSLDGVGPKTRGPHVEGRGGTLTMLDCPEVVVDDAVLSCAGQAVTERTCLTIRGTEGKPLRRVRVTGNRFVVGFAQDGVLVTEASDCTIADNDFETTPLPEGVDRRRVLLSKTFQTTLLRALVPAGKVETAPPPPPAPASDQSRVLQIGAFRAAFTSDIPQSVWDGLVTKNPPTADDQASADAFAQYADKIFEAAGSSQSLVKKYAPDVLRVESASATPLSTAVRAAMLRTGEIKVSASAPPPPPPPAPTPAPAPAPAPAVSNVTIAGVAATTMPKFVSAIGEQGWQTLLARAPIASTITTPAGLSEHLRKAARMALADSKLRGRIAGLTKWFDGKTDALGAWGRQAITVGGKQVGDVSIEHNRVAGFAQAVHVGASTHSADRRQTVSFGCVTVAGNIVGLSTQGDLAYSSAGIFVGNAETVRVWDNLIRIQDGEKSVNLRSGIRIWGRLGRFLAVEKNRVEAGQFAICINPIDNFDKEIAGMMWLAADNLGAAHSSANVLKAPNWVERRYNRP